MTVEGNSASIGGLSLSATVGIDYIDNRCQDVCGQWATGLAVEGRKEVILDLWLQVILCPPCSGIGIKSW